MGGFLSFEGGATDEVVAEHLSAVCDSLAAVVNTKELAGYMKVP